MTVTTPTSSATSRGARRASGVSRRFGRTALVVLIAALPAGAFAAETESQWLLRAEGLEINDRSLIFGIRVKGKTLAADDRPAVVQEHFDRLRTRLILAAAAKRKGYDRDPEVIKPIEEYHLQHLVDLFVEETVDAPARKLAEGKKGRYRWERDNLFKEVTRRANREFPAAIDEQALVLVAQGDAGDLVLARVAGREVRAEEVRHALSLVDHPSDKPSTRESLVRTVLDPLVTIRSLAALAERDGFAARADFRYDLADRLVRRLADRYLEREIYPSVTVTQQEISKFYAENSERLRRGEEREIQEILLADQAAAEAVAARLKAGATFADEVQKNSIGPTRGSGGDLGFLQAAEAHPALAAVIRTMREGDVTPPIYTPFGWHILRCVRVVTGRIPPLDEVGLRIEQGIQQQKRDAAAEARESLLAQEIRVEINESRYQQILRGLVK